MATNAKRISCSIDEQTYTKLLNLKKDKYYDIPWASLYRMCLDKGLEKMMSDKKEN